MTKYRKKPVTVEAVQLQDDNQQAVIQWLKKGKCLCAVSGEMLMIPTLEGTMTARPGDWIIRGIKGEFYPCKDDIFAATYELAE